MTSLCSNSLSVIYTARVTKSPTVTRIEKPVFDFSEIGNETIRLAQLEAECHFCVNDYEVVSSEPVINSSHDMIT